MCTTIVSTTPTTRPRDLGPGTERGGGVWSVDLGEVSRNKRNLKTSLSVNQLPGPLSPKTIQTLS